MSRARQSLWWAGAPARALLIMTIRVYRLTLSGTLGGQCRFHPSCSEYAEQAIRSVGALRGSALAAWRILRCSPLSAGGVDRAPRPEPTYDNDIHGQRVVER
jgi:putative membrane protein insertion efficiency factor